MRWLLCALLGNTLLAVPMGPWACQTCSMSDDRQHSRDRAVLAPAAGRLKANLSMSGCSLVALSGLCAPVLSAVLFFLPNSENEEGAKVCRQCGQKKSEQKAICGV